jgi:hypothetical protein
MTVTHPALQLAVHPAVVRPTESPYLPAGQDVHDEAPLREYCPKGHLMAVELTLPAGQEKPALQLPLHPVVDSAVVFPNFPAGQGEHDAAPLKE